MTITSTHLFSSQSIHINTHCIGIESVEDIKEKKRNDLENRRLTNDLEAKRATKKYQDLLATRANLPAFQMR